MVKGGDTIFAREHEIRIRTSQRSQSFRVNVVGIGRTIDVRLPRRFLDRIKDEWWSAKDQYHRAHDEGIGGGRNSCEPRGWDESEAEGGE